MKTTPVTSGFCEEWCPGLFDWITIDVVSDEVLFTILGCPFHPSDAYSTDAVEFNLYNGTNVEVRWRVNRN